MNATPINPKQEGSNVCDAIPQAGPCPIGCNQCFYNRPGAFFSDISKPLMPTLEEVGDKIVRVNSGNDSNNARDAVIAATAHYPERFFNTSRPHLGFPAPVVLTANPREEDAVSFLVPSDIDGSMTGLMFVRLRVPTTNISIIDLAVRLWTEHGFPIVLTFMRYYDAEPADNDGRYVFKKSIINDYWCPTREFMASVLALYVDNPLVTMCGTLDSGYCRDCRNCETYYWQAKKRMLLAEG